VAAPYKDNIPGIDRSAYGMMFNTNKYGMSLDLTRPKGREVARKLVAWADVVGEGMTPGSMAKLGLDYESCRQIKPDIIYYSTCQFGQKGPYSTFGGYGQMGAAYAGLSHLTGWPDRAPVVLPNAHTDFIAPWYLCSALVAALDYHRRTGKGLYLDMSQVESGVAFWWPGLLDYIVNGRIATRMGNRDPNMAPHGTFPCLGDDTCVNIAVATDGEWQALCRVMGDPEWAREPRFATLLGRKENEDELEHLVAEHTKDYSPHQAMAIFQAAGVPAGVASQMQDLYEDPQLRYRGHFVPLEHKVIGIHHYHMPAYRLSKTPAQLHRAGPCLGQDNEFVYQELLGYSAEEVTQFLLDGVITTEHDIPDILKPRRPG
jgi:benzylsuccinate CoA-transferase BbsF subunit